MDCVKIEWDPSFTFPPCAVGEPVNYTSCNIIATYEDGSTESVAITPSMFNDPNMQHFGTERKILIKYAGHKLSAVIPILPKSLSGIHIVKDGPIRFPPGQPMDKSRIHVLAEYSDGTNREIDNYRYFPFTPLTPADTEIRLKYGRFTHTFPIEVADEVQSVETTPNAAASGDGKTLLGIYVKFNPRTEYTEGEFPDKSDLQVNAIYLDGSEEPVTAEIFPSSPLMADTRRLILIYEGKTAVIPITVRPLSIPAPEPIPEPTPEPEPESIPEPASEPETLHEPEPEPISEQMPAPEPPAKPITINWESADEVHEESTKRTNEPDWGSPSDRMRQGRGKDVSTAAEPVTPSPSEVPPFYPSSFTLRLSGDVF